MMPSLAWSTEICAVSAGFFAGKPCGRLEDGDKPVGAALCRDGLQSSPGDLCNNAEIPGLLRSPFATRGRSYR
ncbi:hypothetical protein, partial [Pseudomonas sp. 1]|uniref:hypothetical protein n=1 Tax=Pseudomonas sp. 1 TaxID=488747 RepID=UPI00209B35C5